MRAPYEVPGYFAGFIAQTFGDHGRDWLGRLPGLVARYVERWDLDLSDPFEGLTFSYVAPVTRADRSSAVLKISIPDSETRTEILMLGLHNGVGCPQRIEYDLEDYAMLIERIWPGTMLSTLLPEREEDATAVVAGIMRASTLDVPEGEHDFPNVADWAGRAMRGLRDTFDGGTGPFPTRIVEEAERAFDELVASTTAPKLLHGDLHHTNVLASDERGWLAIDPKGVVADIGYEAGTFVRNQLPKDPGSSETRRLLARRLDQLSEALDYDRERMRRWALAHCVMSAWWDYPDGEAWHPTVVIAEQLAALSDR